MTKLDVLISEYDDLRQEIRQRVNSQLLILGGNLALFAAIVPAYDALVELASISFLASPVLFAIVTWLYFEQDIFLTQAATYLHRQLRPAVENELGINMENCATPVLQWERFRGDILFARRRERRLLTVMISFRYLATMGPGVGGLLLGVTNLGWSELANAERVIAVTLIVFDLVLAGFLVYLARLVIRLYREISE